MTLQLSLNVKAGLRLAANPAYETEVHSCRRSNSFDVTDFIVRQVQAVVVVVSVQPLHLARSQ